MWTFCVIIFNQWSSSSWQTLVPQAKKEQRKLKGKGKGKGRGKGKKSKGKGKARGRGRGKTFQARTSLKRKLQEVQEEDDDPPPPPMKVDNDTDIDSGCTSGEVPSEEAGTKSANFINKFVLMVYRQVLSSGHVHFFRDLNMFRM